LQSYQKKIYAFSTDITDEDIETENVKRIGRGFMAFKANKMRKEYDFTNAKPNPYLKS